MTSCCAQSLLKKLSPDCLADVLDSGIGRFENEQDRFVQPEWSSKVLVQLFEGERLDPLKQSRAAHCVETKEITVESS